MGRELGLNLAGCPKCGLIQRVEIFVYGAGRVGRINGRDVPLFLRRRVLLVCVRFDQAGIDGHALTADKAFLDAPCNGRLKQVAQQFTLAEPAMTVLGKGRMVGNTVVQIQTTKPALCQVQMHLLAQPPLGPDTKAIAHQQHADQ